MPQVLNLSQAVAGVGGNVRSVRYSLWADPARTVEVPIAQATTITYEAWSGNNASGTLLGIGYIGSQQPLVQLYKSTDPRTLLEQATSSTVV